MTARLAPFLYLSLLVSITAPVWSQTASSPNEGAKIGYDITAGTHSFRWWARDDYYYYIQERNDLMSGSWAFFPYAVKGEDGIEGIDFSSTANMLFLRLAYTNDRTSPLVLADRDGDGFSDLSELDMGTDPFDDTDADENGISDDIDALWASVPNAWKQAIVDSTASSFYDPDGLILSINDINLMDDYDGDGILNVVEYGAGTDPADYFNGQTPTIRIHSGDGQTGAPDSFLGQPIYVKVEYPNGTDYLNAPVRFSTGGYAGLSPEEDPNTLTSTLVSRTGTYGAKALYYTPSVIGDTTVTASLPTGQSVVITVHTVSSASAEKAPIRNFTATDNPDGTTTYSWVSDADSGDWFQIESRQADGSWQPIYQTTYGSQDLPFDSESNAYSLTLDENN